MRDTSEWGQSEFANQAVGRPSQAAGPWAAFWARVWNSLSRVKIRRKPHALHLAETLGLGDRRMLAIVEWNGQQLLIGITPQHITLLDPGNHPLAALPPHGEEPSR